MQRARDIENCWSRRGPDQGPDWFRLTTREVGPTADGLLRRKGRPAPAHNCTNGCHALHRQRKGPDSASRSSARAPARRVCRTGFPRRVPPTRLGPRPLRALRARRSARETLPLRCDLSGRPSGAARCAIEPAGTRVGRLNPGRRCHLHGKARSHLLRQPRFAARQPKSSGFRSFQGLASSSCAARRNRVASSA